MLKQRIITALILAAFVASAIYFLPAFGFALAALCFIVGLAGWEWMTLTVTDAVGPMPRLWTLLPTVALCVALYVLGMPLLPVLLVSVVVWACLIWLLAEYQSGTNPQRYTKQPYILKLTSLLVLAPAWYALIYLHDLHYGYVFYVIALVAVADIGAYFSGKKFGKTKLAPALSPGKTREGVYGALVLTFLWSMVGVWLSGVSGFNAVIFVLFSMFAVVLSVLGDLFESLIKREAGAKDSGTLLPGHGGVLDRIDGLLAALPIFTLGLLWINAGQA